MPSGTFFVRACPTCARKLEIRISLLGRDVECMHCGASFNTNASSEATHNDSKIDSILARAQEYVDSVQTANAATTK